MKTYYVYILANSGNTTIYIGVTNNIERRSMEHYSKVTDGFSKKYKCDKLVYLEETNDIYDALSREKQLKKWSRSKKNKLIECLNPQWRNLFD